MSTSGGPNTKGEENLVFGYDLGDVINSYKGEPTDNLISPEGLDFSVMSTYGNLARTQVADSKSPSGYACEMEVQNAAEINNSSRIRFGTDGAIPTSGDVFITVYAKFEGGYGSSIIPRVFAGYAWYSMAPLDGGSQYLTHKYRRFGVYARVGTSSSGPNPGFSMTQSNSNVQTGQKTRWHSPQVELKTHATPFVGGTRSATTGLRDITGNSTIDIANASFDSDAQMTFDGTSDYASVGYSTALNTPNGATYEVMLYPESGGEFLSRGKSDSGTDPDNPRFYVDGTGYLYFDWSTTGADTYAVTPGSTATFNQWQHVVGVAQPGDQLRIYVNGVEASYNSVVRTVPSPVPNTEDPLIIGGVSWIPRYFDGKIGMVKLYNRALTASEIRSNFNAIKSRFNI